MTSARDYSVLPDIDSKSDKQDPKVVYASKVKAYLEATKDFSSLEKHVYLFLDKDKNFSGATISAALTKMRGSHPDMKGAFIAMFNATHGSGNIICPAFSATFKKDANGYGRFLHLGTTRVWNADGSFNEERWKEFENYVSKDQKSEVKIVPVSKLKAYLSLCSETHPQDAKSGRNNNDFFASKSAQQFAATAAWDEAFDRLSCGKVAVAAKPNEQESYLTLELAKEFFVDSPLAFFRAECGLLPKTEQESATANVAATATMQTPLLAPVKK